ncbi:STAS domain-containing protein [Streptomyces sp. NPDC055722]
MHPEFHASHHEESDGTVVEVQGEADLSTVWQLRDHVVDRIAEGHRRFILDLLGVRFMDSTGLGVLVGLLRRLRMRDDGLRLVIASQRIRRLFTMTGLHAVLPICDSVDVAKAAP